MGVVIHLRIRPWDLGTFLLVLFYHSSPVFFSSPSSSLPESTREFVLCKQTKSQGGSHTEWFIHLGIDSCLYSSRIQSYTHTLLTQFPPEPYLQILPYQVIHTIYIYHQFLQWLAQASADPNVPTRLIPIWPTHACLSYARFQANEWARRTSISHVMVIPTWQVHFPV